LLASRLERATLGPVRLVNPAVNGFTTIDLLAKELGYLDELKPDIVSVLIGVNDLVQGRSPEQYRESLVEIYDAIARLDLAPGRVVAISIPDWSAVPAARDYGDPARIHTSTAAFNDVASREAAVRSFTWVDITSVSLSGMGSKGWIAADGLHPADAQYAAWASTIWKSASAAWTEVRP
jgi:acyl-CoA thioesterase-1